MLWDPPGHSHVVLLRVLPGLVVTALPALCQRVESLQVYLRGDEAPVGLGLADFLSNLGLGLNPRGLAAV